MTGANDIDDVPGIQPGKTIDSWLSQGVSHIVLVGSEVNDP